MLMFNEETHADALQLALTNSELATALAVMDVEAYKLDTHDALRTYLCNAAIAAEHKAVAAYLAARAVVVVEA